MNLNINIEQVSGSPVVEHPKIRLARSLASSYAAQQLSEIQSRSGEVVPDEPVDLAKCYETYSEEVGKHIDKSVTDSGICLTTSETDRTTLYEDTKQRDALDTKIEDLTKKFETCGEEEVKGYFKCHDDNVSILYLIFGKNL